MEVHGKKCSGSEFCKLLTEQCPGLKVKFYRLTNIDEDHRGFQYKTGLNVDIKEFNPSGSCQKGGLYFFDEYNIIRYLRCVHDAFWIREVTIPDDAKVYIEPGWDKYKADKFILGERKKFVFRDLLLEEVYMFTFSKFADTLRYIREDLQTEKMCMIAVRSKGYALRFVRKDLQTEEMCMVAVRNRCDDLQHVENHLQTEEMCMIAVRSKGYVLQYVRKNLRTIEMCKIAIDNCKYDILCLVGIDLRDELQEYYFQYILQL